MAHPEQSPAGPPEPFTLQQLAQPTTRPPRGRGPLIAAVVVLSLLVVGAVAALILVTLDRKPAVNAAAATVAPSAPPATTGSPKPTLVPLDVPATCVILVPLLNEVADMATAFLHDDTVPPSDRVKSLRNRLETVAAVAPASMKSDIDTQIHAVIAMGGGRLDTTEVHDSGLALAMVCAKTASAAP